MHEAVSSSNILLRIAQAEAGPIYTLWRRSLVGLTVCSRLTPKDRWRYVPGLTSITGQELPARAACSHSCVCMYVCMYACTFITLQRTTVAYQITHASWEQSICQLQGLHCRCMNLIGSKTHAMVTCDFLPHPVIDMFDQCGWDRWVAQCT